VSLVAAVGIIAFAGMEGGIVYTRLAGIYTFCFTLLIVIAALAITVFLARDRTGERKAAWQAIATGISFVLLAVALVLAATNFGLLTGTEGEFTWILLLLILGIVAAGMVTAAVLRKKRPAVYARIGREDAAERVPEPAE
jgi:cytochrome bd-type quinol oxidase subunit 2